MYLFVYYWMNVLTSSWTIIIKCSSQKPTYVYLIRCSFFHKSAPSDVSWTAQKQSLYLVTLNWNVNVRNQNFSVTVTGNYSTIFCVFNGHSKQQNYQFYKNGEFRRPPAVHQDSYFSRQSRSFFEIVLSLL